MPAGAADDDELPRATSGLWARAAFTAGDRTVTWAEVVRAGAGWGEWADLRERTASLLSADRQAAAARSPSKKQIQDAGREFRYARNLISADDLRVWERHCEIGHVEWLGYLRRSLLEPAPARDPGLDQTVLERASEVDAVCGGFLVRWVARLSEQFAILCASGNPATTATFDELVAAEDLFHQTAVGDAAIAAVVRSNHLEWTRFDVEMLTDPSVDVISEARMCVSDGLSMNAVAAAAGIPVSRHRLVLEEVPPELRASMTSAVPGEILESIPGGDAQRLIRIVKRHAPSAEDQEVRAQAVATLRRREIVRLVHDHVRWHDHL